MFFSGNIYDTTCWHVSITMFLAFSMIASSIYCLNDIVDIEADRLHPNKCKRPIASGEITPAQAITIMLFLVIISFSFCLLNMQDGWIKPIIILAAYFIMNIAYCLGLKKIAIVDVFIIAAGFILRVVCGGIACNIWVSPWIILMTFLICLFLAFSKRRDDVVIHETQGVVVRNNITSYNIAFMNQTLGLLGAITIVCYMIYTVSPEVQIRLGSQYIYISSIFVLAGILRYLQVALVKCKSGSPTNILIHDHFIHGCLASWIITFAIIIYK